MSRTRTLIAWLAVIGLHLVPCNVYAQDAGPGREVRAIRHDLPLLLTPELRPLNLDAKSLKIDDVLIAGDHALVQWHDASRFEIAIMAKRLDVWWLLHEIYEEGDGVAFCSCGGAMSPGNEGGPATGFLKQLPDVPALLADAASQHLPIVAAADRHPGCEQDNANKQTTSYCVSPHGDGWCTSQLSFMRPVPWFCDAGPYGVMTTFAPNDAASDSFLDEPYGRAPTDAESWLTEGGNAYFYFSGTLKSPSAVHVSSGTTLDVWFPFVLDPNKTYSLTIAHVSPTIGPIDGTLKDNTLHFVLPAFAIDPGATLMGEIDGDPLDNP